MREINSVWLSSMIGNENYPSLVNEIYNSLFDLRYEYANFRSWYFNKVIPQIESGERDIFVTMSKNNIAGVLIVKDEIEKKICTLRVSPYYQKQGLGKVLFEKAFDKLQIEKPIITVSQKRYRQFSKILEYYGFEFACTAIHYYSYGSVEHCYNGILEKKPINNMESNDTLIKVSSY